MCIRDRPSPCQDTQGVFPHGYARIPSGTICVVPSFLSTIQTGGAEDDSNIGGVLRMARSKCLSPYLTEKSLLVAFFALCEKEAQRILPFLVGKTRGRVPPSSFSFQMCIRDRSGTLWSNLHLPLQSLQNFLPAAGKGPCSAATCWSPGCRLRRQTVKPAGWT